MSDSHFWEMDAPELASGRLDGFDVVGDDYRHAADRLDDAAEQLNLWALSAAIEQVARRRRGKSQLDS